MRPNIEPPVERPLNGATRLALVIGTAATIALFYLFLSVSMVFLLVWIGLFMALIIAAARFGVAGFFIKYLERDFRLLTLLAGALWLKEGTRYRLRLQPADAPRLFDMVNRLARRLAIPPPDELCLEMSSGAWVELRGLKTGLGTTRVGVGYDLLAVLSEKEVEAVMAHELAHAKLIGRAFKNWLSRGLARATNVSNQLFAAASAYRRANESFGFGNWIFAGSDALTRLCAGQMGAYSRQGEFEADHGAAQLCGATAIRSSLQRLEAVQPVLNRLPWNERIAQIESPDGLSSWLRRELAKSTLNTAENTQDVRDPYSTHPALRDRLAALPDEHPAPDNSPSGINLLANPDKIALNLVDAIERSSLLEEQKDLRDLRKLVRKARSTGHYRLAELPGYTMVLAGIVFGIAGALLVSVLLGLVIGASAIALGLGLLRLARYRDRRVLPVPEFSAFMSGRKKFPLPHIESLENELEKEFRALIASERNNRRKAALLVDEAYAALGRCDYLRAHTSARIASEFDQKSVERALAMVVAAAAFGQEATINELTQFILNKTKARSRSSAWALAWALMLGANWAPAEGLLHETVRAQPDDSNLLAMLALCQSRRGKLQSAIQNARHALALRKPSEEHLRLFVGLLLDRGALREASERLAELDPESPRDPEVIYLRVRLHLLRREFDLAESEFAKLTEELKSGHLLIEMGYLYQHARADAKAVEFFQLALSRGHYPDALLALAQHASEARDKARAREHILAALDTSKELGAKASSPLDVFHRALAQLASLEEPVANCRAWIASFLPGKDVGPLTKHSLIVLADTEKAVEGYLETLLRAMRPNVPPVAPAYMLIKSAPRDMQPDRPQRPGVQYIYQ